MSPWNLISNLLVLPVLNHPTIPHSSYFSSRPLIIHTEPVLLHKHAPLDFPVMYLPFIETGFRRRWSRHLVDTCMRLYISRRGDSARRALRTALPFPALALSPFFADLDGRLVVRGMRLAMIPTVVQYPEHNDRPDQDSDHCSRNLPPI